MIIVEGPDGSGKTELIRRLGYDRRNLKALRGGVGASSDAPKGWATGGDEPALVEYVRKVVSAKAEEMATGTPIALDRFHLSERVYGPMLRNSQEVEDGCLYQLNEYLRFKRVPVILCLPSFETTLFNVVREGRPRPIYQTEEFLNDAYSEWTRLTPWATVVWNYETDPLPVIG